MSPYFTSPYFAYFEKGVEFVGRLKVKLSFHLSKLNCHGQYGPISHA